MAAQHCRVHTSCTAAPQLQLQAGPGRVPRASEQASWGKQGWPAYLVLRLFQEGVDPPMVALHAPQGGHVPQHAWRWGVGCEGVW